MTSSSIVFAILALFSSLLLVFATMVHVKRRNLPLSTLAIGLLVLNIFNAVNVLVWNHPESQDWWDGSGLCDIEVKLYLGIGQSIIGVTASIFRRLAIILDTNKLMVEISSKGNIHQLLFEICVIYVLPATVMCLHYLVQPNRYALSRFAGCRVTWDPSWPAVLLLWMWYPAACAVCLYYSFLTVLRLLQHRRQVDTILQHSHTNGNKTRFWRLFALSLIFALFFVPFAAYFFVYNVAHGINSGYSWSAIHPPDWSNQIVRDTASDSIALDRWAQVVAGILLFLLFGMGKEAMATYLHILPSRIRLRVSERLLQHKHLGSDSLEEQRTD